MSARLSMSTGQRRLAVAWLALGLSAFLLLFAQTAGDESVYRARAKDVWAWFLPMVVPTLSLVITTVAGQARQPQAEATVDRLAYQLALVLSVLYLLALIGTLVMGATSSRPMDVLENATFFLAPIQTFVGLSLGAFFVSKSSERSEAGPQRANSG